MSEYVKKKLPYVHVYGVLSIAKERGRERARAMQQIPQPYAICGVPEGRYCLVADGILFPKKRRGEKFIVKYTQMHEKEF